MDNTTLEILYEKGPCLVVNKPPGILTQAPPGIDSVEVRIKNYLRDGRPEEESIYLGVPHRLDRPASGAMVFCTKHFPTRRVAAQFESREVNKFYWAWVSGRVSPDTGTWEDYLRKVPGEARAEVVEAGDPEGRPAVLHYRAIEENEQGTLLEIRLETGRTHQVRVQAAVRGHAIFGDRLYGSTVEYGPQFEDERDRAIALHARFLEFRHPNSKEIVSVTAPVGAIWREFFAEEAT